LVSPVSEYGFTPHVCERAGQDWIGLRVDFETIFGGVACTDDDFTLELLASPASADGCLLGAETRFKRRKQCSFCLNSLSHEIDSEQTPCACQPEDLKCAYGFTRANNVNVADGACSEDADHFADLCVDGQQTAPMTFYEKVPDDRCKPTDISTALLTPRSTYCNGNGAGPTTVPTDFSYRGCYVNKDDDRVAGHVWHLTFAECRTKAQAEASPLFGLE
jgi:hypothetical protein